MPTIREIVRDAARRTTIGCRPSSWASSRAPRSRCAGRSSGNDRSSEIAYKRVAYRQGRRGDDHHEEAHVAAHGAARHGRDAWRCRSSTRWCPRGRCRRRRPRPGKIRFSCIEQVHGAAGSTKIGLEKNLWSPAAVGRAFDLTPTSLSPLEPYRDYLTIVSNTDVRNAEAFLPNEIGGDHFRSSAVFLTQAHPKQTEGSDVLRRPVDRSALRAEVRPGHADSVDAAVHRERRSGRRLRLRLRLRLHRHDQLGDAEDAAADDSRPALRVRSAVRRRRHAGGARRAPPRPTAASSTG